jgi:hypothetical protein
MSELGPVSILNVNGNVMQVKDAVLTEVVNEIISAIGANNSNIAERINNLHNRSFDYTIKISSNNDSEIANIQDGLYKVQYITSEVIEEETVETLINSAILIQKGNDQYLLKDGQILSRTKSDNTWSTWANNAGTLSNNYEMSSDSNSDLSLEAGDTYEEAFAKLEKAIIDNEYVNAAALIDLNTQINNLDFISTETQLSKGTSSGAGNAVTDINVSNHQITLVKGTTFLTEHQSIKTVNGQTITGTGNVTISGLPEVTSSDNGKILMVVNGQWQLVSPSILYSGTGAPNNENGNNGDIYVQTGEQSNE